MFYAAILPLAREIAEAGKDESISFVFDEHGSLGAEAVEWFYIIKNQNPGFSSVLKTAPIFQNDKIVTPLQAADILAWHLRRKSEWRDEELPAYNKFVGDTLITVEVDDQTLKKLGKEFNKIEAVRTLQTKKSWKKVKPHISNSISSRIEPKLPKKICYIVC